VCDTSACRFGVFARKRDGRRCHHDNRHHQSDGPGAPGVERFPENDDPQDRCNQGLGYLPRIGIDAVRSPSRNADCSSG